MKLIDVIKTEYIKIPLKGNSKEEVIKELIDTLHSQNLFENAGSIFSAVMEREKIMTTGVGKSVAIPHCKKKECKNFAIAFGVHPRGIDFSSIDNLPVKIIFLLIGPDGNPGMHIRLLSRISRIISNDSLRQNIMTCQGADEAIALLKKEEEKYFEIAS